MHRVWATRRAWRVRLLLAIGLALLLLPLAWRVHPAWVLGSLLGLLYPSRWEELRALADLDRRYGLAYRSALEAPPNHPWRDQLQLESQASLRGARLPAWPWVFAALYLLLLGVVWVLPPPYRPAAAWPNETASPASSPAASSPELGPQPSKPPSSSEGQQPSAKPGEATSPAQPEEPRQQARDAQGQNSPQEAAAQDATRSAQPGESPQSRGQDPEPQQEGPPGENPLREKGEPQTDRPGQAAQPLQTGRRPSGQTEPIQPSQSQPDQAQPSQPGQAQPPQPLQSSPQSSPAQPGEPPAQGSGGGPAQTPDQPPRPPQVGQAPLSRGENRPGRSPSGRSRLRAPEGRPQPLPSPWPSGQPPQNVQRQAEKYLESEPLPPEVREVLRRYFELPMP